MAKFVNSSDDKFFMAVLLYDLGYAFYTRGSFSAETNHVFNVAFLSYLRKIK